MEESSKSDENEYFRKMECHKCSKVIMPAESQLIIFLIQIENAYEISRSKSPLDTDDSQNSEDFNNSKTECERREFHELFNGQKLKKKISFENYFKRLAFYSDISEEILTYASFLFLRVISDDKLPYKYSNYAIKVFGTCVYLSQKILQDKGFHPDSMAKLLGMPKKKLHKKEFYIMEKILEFSLNFDQSNFEEFIKIVNAS